MKTRDVVAIINTSEDQMDVLAEILEDEGRFRAVTAMAFEFREGKRSFDDFIREHAPRAIIWDIAIPYEENWHYFAMEVRPRHPALPFIVTTTNRAVLERLVGPTDAHELVGKPYDLAEILAAIERAVAGERPGSAAP